MPNIIINNNIITTLEGVDNLLYSLLILMILDYLTEILSAICYPKLYGKLLIHSLICKIAILVLIIASTILDNYLLQCGSTIRSVTIIFYISEEGNSLLNNINRLGIPIPYSLKNTIQRLFNSSHHNNEN